MLNRFYEQMRDAEPAVGMGATIMMYTDRRPVVITAITYFKSGARVGQPREVAVREVEVDAQPWPSGYADAIHLDRPKGAERTFTVRKDGRWRDAGGTYLKIGQADYYYDPSF